MNLSLIPIYEVRRQALSTVAPICHQTHRSLHILLEIFRNIFDIHRTLYALSY